MSEPGRELERTRVYQMSDFPPGTRMLQGDRRELDAYLATQPVRAVGRYHNLPGGGVQIPVVYVSRRAQPFYVRHRVALSVSGVVLTLAASIAWVIISVGVWWFLGGVAAAAFIIATIVRWSRGGGRTSVSVTTTTTTNVKVRR
jgi:hypothetical protein